MTAHFPDLVQALQGKIVAGLNQFYGPKPTLSEEFEDTKGVMRIRKSKKDRQHNCQQKEDKQRSTKHYTEN